MVDGNKLGNVGFEKLGTPYEEMDCQKFVEWCLKQCGCNKDLPGSNAWYREVMKNGVILSPEECVRQLGCVPQGAFLFIHSFDGGEESRGYHDGLGNASHMGICTIPRGKGSIQSSKSKGGVCEGVFKQKTINGGWNKVGLWNQVCYDYGGGVDPIPEPEPAPVPSPEPFPANTAIVGNVPVGNRQDVNLRKRPSSLSALVDRVPCGETVEVISTADDWSLVKWEDKKGYMMTKFLIFDEDDEQLYCVTIHNLPIALAEEIANTYGGSITEEKG